MLSSLPPSSAARISPGTPCPPATSQRTDLAGRKPIFPSDEVQCQDHKCKAREGVGVKPGRAVRLEPQAQTEAAGDAPGAESGSARSCLGVWQRLG